MIDPESGQEILLTRPSKLGIALKRGGFWVFLVAVLVLIGVYAYSSGQPKVYTATGGIFVTEGANANGQDVQTISALVDSSPVLSGAATILIHQDQLRDESLGTLTGQVAIAPAASENVVSIVVSAPAPAVTVDVVKAIYNSYQRVNAGLPVSQQRTVYLSTPAAPTSPSEPRPLRNAGVGFVLAILIGVGIVWLREVRRPTAADMGLVAETLNVPLFADLAGGNLLQRRSPESRSRGYVALSLDLDELAPKGTRVLCLAGVRPGDLDLNLPYGLATAFANGAWRVVLIDGDPERALSKALNAAQKPGLTDLPGSELQVAETLIPAGASGLSVIPFGRRGFDRAQQNLLSELQRVFDELTETSDLVIVAIPDVSQDSSARILAAACQGLILAVRGSTPLVGIESAQERLALFRAKLIGFIRDEPAGRLSRSRGKLAITAVKIDPAETRARAAAKQSAARPSTPPKPVLPPTASTPPQMPPAPPITPPPATNGVIQPPPATNGAVQPPRVQRTFRPGGTEI